MSLIWGKFACPIFSLSKDVIRISVVPVGKSTLTSLKSIDSVDSPSFLHRLNYFSLHGNSMLLLMLPEARNALMMLDESTDARVQNSIPLVK